MLMILRFTEAQLQPESVIWSVVGKCGVEHELANDWRPSVDFSGAVGRPKRIRGKRPTPNGLGLDR